MDVQHHHTIDVVPAAADAPQAGDEANGSVNSVGPQDVENSGPPQEAAAAAAGGDASPGNAQGQPAAAQQESPPAAAQGQPAAAQQESPPAAAQGQPAAAQQASPPAAAAHDADAQESQVERTIGVGEISLTENLNDIRHIDILIKQSNGPRPQATGVGAAPEDTAALNGRLKITVVLEEDADRERREEDKLMAMRGWLMTVGTLFVAMAFQAALHPPEWMNVAGTAPAMQFAPSPGPSPQAAESTTGLSVRTKAYMVCNVFTFATALSLVLLLLVGIRPARAKHTMKVAAWMMFVIALSVGATYAMGSSERWSDALTTGIGIEMFALGAFYCVIAVVAMFKTRERRTGERPAPSPDHAP